jgi:hypothetical protein
MQTILHLALPIDRSRQGSSFTLPFLGTRHEGLVGAMAARGYEQAARFFRGEDVCVQAKGLVAPDMVVVPVAADDGVDWAAGQGFCSNAQFLGRRWRNEATVNEGTAAEVDGTSVADRAPVRPVDGSIDALGQPLEPEVP